MSGRVRRRWIAYCHGWNQTHEQGARDQELPKPLWGNGIKGHVYQSSQGGQTFCPLDQQARIINSTTPRFAKMCSSKYALLNSVSAQNDLSDNHGRQISRCYLQDIAQDVTAIAEAKDEHWNYAEPELRLSGDGRLGD